MYWRAICALDHSANMDGWTAKKQNVGSDWRNLAERPSNSGARAPRPSP